MNKISLLSLSFLLLFSACREDNEDTQIIDETPDPTIIEGYEPNQQSVNGSLIGFVVNENNEPVVDATVKLGNQTITTDNFGHFFYNDIDMNALGTLVQVDKEGYFPGSRRFFPNQNAKNRVKIELLEKSFSQSFDAQSGGLISLPDGASINFEANSISTSDGTAYTGTVSVATKWMDPTALRTFDQMPGNLQGVGLSTENEEVVLGTYGMMAVELQGDAGEALNIADDMTATLTMPIPTALQTNAPSSIILWSYNETYGIWVEESTATLQNNTYVGEVNHFSFWNCDIPLDYIDLSLVLIDESGINLANIIVTISLEDVGCGTGYTDENGAVNGFVPSGEVLLMEVFDICGNVLYSENIGPFDTDTDLGNIPINSSSTNTTTISGELLCDGEAIDNGLIAVSYDGNTLYHYVEGTEFDFSFTTCVNTSEIEVQGINVDDLMQSDPISAIPNTENDLGAIDICAEELTNHIQITIDGVTMDYLPTSININDSTPDSYSTDIYSSITPPNTVDSTYLQISFYGITDGDYSSDHQMIVQDFSKGWGISGSLSSGTFTVSDYGEPGQNIIGSFSGTIINLFTQEEVDINGSFSVIRQE